ncbi:unnamed protein product [Eruca vesicaria subsp. sativa]|uniref:PUM-HD domain-containing protein n=1 Tax=Eruca vesicaria subsp. sativa TaxID=29727 RepID=A0ABC8ISR3_ERUVS|nr:unnamed protein product [Eruca vesicaria subsp. sativa]
MAPPPPRFVPPRLITEENRSLINSFRSATSTPQETDTCMRSLHNLMTSNEDNGAAQFRAVISELNAADLQKMAWLLTSNSRYFLNIARNKNGSTRLQKLLGESDDVDTFFLAAFFRNFLPLMTNKEGSYVVFEGLRVFSNVKKMAMFPHIIEHVDKLASDPQGCVAFNGCITVLDDHFIRGHMLNAVVINAVSFSYHHYGNFVVQHVLDQGDLRSTRDIAVNLRGHCVALSLKRYGSYIVQKLLNARDLAMVLVVEELLECGEERFVRLARDQFGNFVVRTALRVTREERDDLFRGLVNKLRPLVHLLGGYYNIAAFLNSIH